MNWCIIEFLLQKSHSYRSDQYFAIVVKIAVDLVIAELGSFLRE